MTRGSEHVLTSWPPQLPHRLLTFGSSPPSVWSVTLPAIGHALPLGSELCWSDLLAVPSRPITSLPRPCGWSFFVNGSLGRLITTGEGPVSPPWA